MTHNQSVETDLKMTKMLKLAIKDFNMFEY